MDGRRSACPAADAALVGVDHAHIDIDFRLGEVVRVDALGVGAAVVVGEARDQELLALVAVDRALVNLRHRVGTIDLRHDDVLVLVDDHEVVDVRSGERHVLGGIGLRHPVVAPARLVQDASPRARGSRARRRSARVVRPNSVALVEGQLERGALEVIDENDQVVGVDDRGLLRPLEEVVGLRCAMYWSMAVERQTISASDVSRAAAGATRLLQRGGERARIAGQDRDVERTDVDAELERVGRDHLVDLAVAQPRSTFERRSLGR